MFNKDWSYHLRLGISAILVVSYRRKHRNIQCAGYSLETCFIYQKKEECIMLQIDHATSKDYYNLQGWPCSHSLPGSNANYSRCRY